MMGERRVMQEALFYGFSLERRVPDNHLLRKIDRFVDLSEVRAHLGPYYSDVGRPSIDPELMIRMLIVGYGFGIRSERRLGDKAKREREFLAKKIIALARQGEEAPTATGTLRSRAAATTAFSRTRSDTLKWPIATPSFWLCSRAFRKVCMPGFLLGIALSRPAGSWWSSNSTMLL